MQTELKKEFNFTICPYCNGEMVDDQCREYGWRPEYEFPEKGD